MPIVIDLARCGTPNRGVEAEMDVRLRWWQWLLVVVSGVGLGIFADWLLGTYLRIPRVRFPIVLGVIVWILLSPLLFDRQRSR